VAVRLREHGVAVRLRLDPRLHGERRSTAVLPPVQSTVSAVARTTSAARPSTVTDDRTSHLDQLRGPGRAATREPGSRSDGTGRGDDAYRRRDVVTTRTDDATW
jgi:hypothetical protein